MDKKDYRTIKVCAGIGDSIWILQKLINSKEQFHFQIPDGSPQRGKPLYDLLPQIAISSEYVPGLNYSKLNRDNIQNKKRRWVDVSEKIFALTANSHVEAGMRIEQFLPDLPTSYRLNYMTTAQDAAVADKLLYD